MTTKFLCGSTRRLIAFGGALAVLGASGLLKLDGAAVAAITTLALGYIGQGVVKEIKAATAP